VAEDRHARLEARPLLDLALELDRDPAEPDVAERVLRLELRQQPAVLRGGALGDDDDREVAALGVAPAQAVADLVHVERALGHEDHVSAAGEAAVRRDPARMAAHHLDDDDAVVRLRRGVEPVDRVGRDLHGGLEAEREVGAGEVVVDRLGDADDGDARLRELAGDAERVLAADRDERVEPQLVERGPDAIQPVLLLEHVGPGGAEDRPAAMQDAARALVGQLHRVGGEYAGPAVAEADELVSVRVDPLAHDGADDGVEAGAVPASGQKSDSSHIARQPTRI
jgi:hypothetical protein